MYPLINQATDLVENNTIVDEVKKTIGQLRRKINWYENKYYFRRNISRTSGIPGFQRAFASS